MRKRFTALGLLTLMLMLMALPVYGATVADLPDNSLILGQDVFDLTNTTNYNFANSLAAAATGSNIYYKFNGHWFNLCDGSVTNFSDYFNASKYIDASASSWTLRKWYRTGSTIESFNPTLSEVSIGQITPVVSGTATAPILTFTVTPTTSYSEGTATLSENVSYTIVNSTYSIGTGDTPCTATTSDNLMQTALDLAALYGGDNFNGSSVLGSTLIDNSPLTITLTGANGTTTYEIRFEELVP